MDIPLQYIHSVTSGTIVYDPGGRYGPRVQLDAQLVLLHTGSVRITVDGAPFDVPSGHAALLLPGHTELFEFDRDAPTWHRWIAVRLTALPEDVLLRLQQLPRIAPLTEAMNGVTDLLLSLRGTHRGTGGAFRSLGLAALQLYASEHPPDRPAPSHPWVDAAKDRIRERYAEELSLPDLARSAGVSPEHLVRLFRQHEGTTPMKYAWNYRVRQAVELLMNTGLPIGDIAARCGFKTSYHFARMIRQSLGKTPSQIRADHWRGP